MTRESALSTYDEDISSQRLSESSNYWKQLFSRALLYVNNPEDAASRDFTFQDVTAFDIPFMPAERITERMGSPGPDGAPFSTFSKPPAFLQVNGNVQWRVISTGLNGTKTEDVRSNIYMKLATASKYLRKVKFSNDFPASPPSISTSCSTDEIIHRCASFEISSETVQRVKNGQDNHLAVLTIAWVYILSALWGDSQGSAPQYLYSTPEVREFCKDPHIVYVPGEDSEAANWWQQLLAQGTSGWKITMEYRETEYQSPWSIHIPSEVGFRVISQATPKSSPKPPDAATALEYLARYCTFHGITRQAETALAAALILPTHFYDYEEVNLPKPVHMVDLLAIGTSSQFQQPNPDPSLLRLLSQLPHLMTISASMVGNILASVFYNPDVDSTLSGEWYEPAVKAWPPSTAHAAVIGSLRSPCLSRWWIGAGVTSYISQRNIYQNSSRWHTDLHLALWTRSSHLSPHSFICKILTEDGVTLRTTTEAGTRLVRREDEILVYFLYSATGPQKTISSPPPAPFHPPGYAELDKSSLQVIGVAEAETNMRLQFLNCAWETRDGITKKETISFPAMGPFSFFSDTYPEILPKWEMPDVKSILYRALNTSENDTRSNMSWICERRGEEADQDRGDIDLVKLFEAYND